MTGGWTYTWPTTLRLPSRPPKLVYLDLLHWISLSKANKGRRDGEPFRDALRACVAAVDAGAAVFPISASIYMEVTKIGQPRQRHDLRTVIERVSGYRVIAPRVVIGEHEVEAMLDRLLGPSPDPIHAIDYLDWGFERAHGKVRGFKVKSEATGENVTDKARSKYPDGPETSAVKFSRPELELNRWVLDGPTAAEELMLPAFGYDRMATYKVQTERAAQEIKLVEWFNADPSRRGPHIRDVVVLSEIAIEIKEVFERGVNARGMDLETVLAKFGPGLDAFDSMPSFDVSVSLKTAYHRNPEHRWKPNHIQDIDALAETVPYCDIVVTDKEAASHLVQTGVAERLNTTVLSRTTDLIRYL
jgi:hypothetical protein